MIFRQLFDPKSSTYTYLLACEKTREAVIIDSVFEQFDRDSALIRELGLSLSFVLETHVHADHVTGAWLLKQAFGAHIALSRHNAASGVDMPISDGDTFSFGDYYVTALDTPGHTAGCLTFVTQDQKMAFTGDCLMIRGAGRTDFQSGDVHTMWHSIRDVIFALPDDCLVYPGHDYQGRTVSTVGEEKQLNPRLGGEAKEEDFAGYMNNLGLPHPKLLEIAVPANLQCGRPEGGEMPEQESWGPITKTFAGVPEIQPEWVAGNIEDIYILDVRNQAEFNGELGHLKGSVLVPLDQLRMRLDEIPDSKPIVAVCQSGKRSAMATQILRSAGFDRVANIPGGLIHWMHMALPFREID